MVFQDTFEYYANGELNAEQFSELMMLIYRTRFLGENIDILSIEDKDIRMIWRTLKHTILKSRRNAKSYQKSLASSVKEPIQPNEEFDKETGEIIETENKAPEGPLKEESDKDIIFDDKVSEMAQNEVIMPNVRIVKTVVNKNNNPINTDKDMYIEDGKKWHTEEEMKAVAKEIWETYEMNKDTDFDDFKRNILPKYTEGWANVDRTKVKDLIGLAIHNLKTNTATA